MYLPHTTAPDPAVVINKQAEEEVKCCNSSSTPSDGELIWISPHFVCVCLCLRQRQIKPFCAIYHLGERRGTTKRVYLEKTV